MKRPENLPDFRNPPLHEVLLGIQFTPPPTYQQIRAREVWALFEERFPIVQELPPLAPYFETFGGPHISFDLVAGAQHNRFWFVSPEGDELIQFQNDRLLRNWRKIQKPNNDYPRYEHIVQEFEKEAGALNSYFSSIGSQALDINQCEIAYINHIVPLCPGHINPSDWLSFVRFPDAVPDDFSFNFRRRINDENGRPIGRLSFEGGMSSGLDGPEIIALTITARAMPRENNLQSALEFFARGREMIVSSFAEVTTDSAHKVWERIR